MRKILKNIFKAVMVLGVSAAFIAAYNIYRDNSTEDIASVIEANEVAMVESADDSNISSSGRKIISWGDSITYGLGSGDGIVNVDGESVDISDWAYTDALEYFTGLDVYNLGVCSETSYEIALRQGGLAMYVDKAVTVRAGKSSKINIVDAYGNKVELQNFNGYASYNDEPENLVYIDNAPYQLTYNNGSWYISFYDTETTGSVKIKKNSQVVTQAAHDIADTASDVLIIQMGSNGGWDDYDMLISQYKAMIANSGTQCYIIIGDTDNPDESIEGDYYSSSSDVGLNDTYWEAALREAFGEHFINMRTYMLENAMDIAGLEPTEEDEYNLANSMMPESIKSDYTHMNAYGYYVIGAGVYEKGSELGYW